MADSGFQASVLDGVARIVGGTVSGTDSHFYSGDLAADGTGVAGLKGCYSTAPNSLQSTPVAVVYPGHFTAELHTQGEEINEDEVKVILYVANYNAKTQMAVLAPFRDTVPAAFRAHMWAYNAAAANVLDAFVTSGDPAVHTFGGIDYLGWTFNVRVRRLLNPTYVA